MWNRQAAKGDVSIADGEVGIADGEVGIAGDVAGDKRVAKLENAREGLDEGM